MQNTIYPATSPYYNTGIVDAKYLDVMINRPIPKLGSDVLITLIKTYEYRPDLLAYDFYQDSSLWWVIASANALPGDSIYPPIGIQLRIPTNIQSILNNYNLENNGF